MDGCGSVSGTYQTPLGEVGHIAQSCVIFITPSNRSRAHFVGLSHNLRSAITLFVVAGVSIQR